MVAVPPSSVQPPHRAHAERPVRAPGWLRGPRACLGPWAGSRAACPCSAASPLLFLQQLWFWMPGPWPCCSFVPAARGHWVASACLSVLVLLQNDSPLHAHHGPVPVSSGLQSWEAHIPESRLLASALQLSAPSASRVHVCVSALLSTCDVRHRGSSPGAPRPCSWSQRALSGARGSRWVGRAPGAGAGQTSCA